jgi:Ser/Thr protein kinase RdoA (MazF antagonist)
MTALGFDAIAVPVDGRVVRRARSARASSFALEELDVVTDDGTVVQLVHKDCAPDRMLPDARRARPAFLIEPGREAAMYREVLDAARHGTPRCHATTGPPATPILVLERVDGPPIEEVAYGAAWHATVRWLARFHAAFAAGTEPGERLAGAPWLARYDRDYFARWPERAIEHVRGDRRAVRLLGTLARRYDPVLDALVAQPRSLVHGDFHPANVLVGAGGRICTVDWELAGWGPSLLDLASFTSGRWPRTHRRALARSYRRAVPDARRWPDERSFVQALDCCQLHLALQWLGWSADWAPEERRTTDWLAVALACAERLGI